MGSIGGDQKTAHVLVIPFLGHGHMAPMLRLARQLSRKGIAITFVSFEDQISRLASHEEESPGFQFIGLDHRGVEAMSYSLRVSIELREGFKPFLEKLVQNKRSGIAGPTCILSDMFLPWTQDIAEELQIPRYMFVTSGVVYAKILQSFADRFGDRVRISETDGKLVKFDGSVDIPGLFPMSYHELPNRCRQHPSEWLLTCKSLWRSRGVLANSYYELEEQMVDTWTRPGAAGFEHTKGPKIYPVGPFFSTSVTVPDIKIIRQDSAKESLLWLSSQPSSSVLYIALGTEVHLSREHINEMALGLENSNQRFLWVLLLSTVSSGEEASSITDVLPPGFEARIGDRGCIVTGWVPQLQILAHSATAAYLTHNGWNSSLESVMMGVPMISWPQRAEQYLNCRYLVDHMKVAIQLQTGPENILKRKEVERTVRLLMVESEGKVIKRQAEDLQKKGAAAVAEGGSKSRFFQDLVDDIKLL